MFVYEVNMRVGRGVCAYRLFGRGRGRSDLDVPGKRKDLGATTSMHC